MAQAERTRTFGELKSWVLSRANVSSHFALRDISKEHAEFWEGMNSVEYKRGYVAGEYEKPESPALCDMKLLTEVEFAEWKLRFDLIGKPS